MNPTQRYPRVVVVVAPDEVDIAVGELFSLGASGVEEQDDDTLVSSRESGKVTLVATFSQERHAVAAIDALRDRWEVSRDDVVAEDWEFAWRRFVRPFNLTPTVRVRPSWDADAGLDDAHVLTIEPGRAFGSGTHPTTSLVATVIERHLERFQNMTVLDVGCGSGLLALCALVHGAGRAVAIDNDPEAVRETKENAARNGLASLVEASDTDVADVIGTFPLVMANIRANILIEMASALSDRLAPDGLLVLSGVMEHEIPDVTEAFAPRLGVRAITQRYEWVAMELEHAGS